MPSTRIGYAEIQSWTPALMTKAVESGALFVLSGDNYYFDSKGPKSGFGSRRISSEVINFHYSPVESIYVADKLMLFTEDRALQSQANAEAEVSYFTLLDWESYGSAYPVTHKWTHAYVGYTTYVCSPVRGIYTSGSASLQPLVATALPENPIAICENSGRLIVLNRFTISYSAPFDGSNFSSEIGGAGFQVLAELIPGNPIALLSFEGGFYVFTDRGALIAEFVGGDVVYRFDRSNTNLIPLSNTSWVEMNEGSGFFLSSVGFYQILPNGGFKEATQLFNEYFRAEIYTSDFNVRLMYVPESDMLYMQIMSGTSHYNRTLVLRVSLDKWGVFSEDHLGIIRVSTEPNDIGYVDLSGRVHRFDSDLSSKEDTDGIVVPLKSQIELGYIRPAAESTSADVDFELQEILVSAGLKSTASIDVVDLNDGYSWVDYNAGFYRVIDDWNGYGLIDFQDDYYLPGDSEDWNAPGPSVDHNAFVIGGVYEDWSLSGIFEDYNLTPVDATASPPTLDLMLAGESEELSHQQSCLNNFNYGLRVISNLDGWENQLETTPVKAVQKSDSDLWTLLSHGHNHRLLFSANSLNEKFHIQTLAITIHLAGQLS